MTLFENNKKKKPFNPAAIKDQIALETEWFPMVSGGASFGTHNLKAIGRNRIQFTPSLMAYFFSGAFGLGGIISLVVLIQIVDWRY